MTIKIMVDKRSQDAPFIAYTPDLDVVSCGPTEKKARQNLHDAVEIIVEEAEKKGKLKKLLEYLGFQKEKGRFTALIHQFMKQIYGPNYYHKTPKELREILLNRYETKKRP